MTREEYLQLMDAQILRSRVSADGIENDPMLLKAMEQLVAAMSKQKIIPRRNSNIYIYIYIYIYIFINIYIYIYIYKYIYIYIFIYL